MKRILLPLMIISAGLFSACSSNKEEPKRDMVLLNDEMYKSSMNTDTAVLLKDEPIEEIPVITSKPAQNRKPAAQPRRNYNNAASANNQTAPSPVVTPPVAVASPNPAPATAPAATPGSGTETASTSGTETAADAETVPAKKTGMSKGAQGAIIGGVGGAVVGAVLSKKGKGAVIGGVIGAAGGYILGRKKDKADGRVGNFQYTATTQ